MKSNKLRLAPIRLSSTAWYYEEHDGLTVVAEKRDKAGNLTATTLTEIPWSKVKASVKRQERP